MKTVQSARHLDHERTVFAYRKVAAWGAAYQGEAATLSKGLPVTLRGEGLILTLAMLMRRDGRAHAVLAELLAEWLLDKAPVKILPPGLKDPSEDPPKRLLRALADEDLDRSAYLAAQAEALLLLERVKLLAQALWAKQTSQGGGDGR